MHSPLRILLTLCLLSPAASVYVQENAAPALSVPLTPAPTRGDFLPFLPCSGHFDTENVAREGVGHADDGDKKKPKKPQELRRCFCGPEFESMPPTINQCVYISCDPDDWWTGANIRRWMCAPYSPDNPTPKSNQNVPEPFTVPLFIRLLNLLFFNALAAPLVEVFRRSRRLRNNNPVDRSKYLHLAFGIIWGCTIARIWFL